MTQAITRRAHAGAAPAEAAGPLLPLTEAQLGLWYAQRLDPDNPVYNTSQYLEIDGPLDLAAFRRAVETALAEADALSVRIVDRPEGPCQQVAEAARAGLEVIDLSAEPDPAAAARAAIDRDMATALDPTADRMVAEQLFVLGPDRHLWYQRIHHLVVDAYGTALLNARIAELYGAAAEGRPPAPATWGSLADLVREDAAYRSSERRAADRAAWLEMFRERPEVTSLAPGPAVSDRSWHRREIGIDEATVGRLHRVADSSRVAWPDVLVTLVAAFLRRHTRTPFVVVGVPHMGRLGSVAARVPAMVMNVLPVEIGFDEAAPLGDAVAEVARRLRLARRHGRYRSEQLRRDLGLIGGARRLHGPLINVVPFDMSIPLAGLATRLHLHGAGAVEDLTFTFRVGKGGRGLRLELDANPQLYAAATVDALAARLVAFLVAGLGAGTLAEVPTVTAAEHEWLIHGVNATAHPVEATTLAVLIEETMRRRGDATALAQGAAALSYRELDAQSLALARRLAGLGVRRGDIVAAALPRSIDLVVALVAVLRAGAAYLPLDIEHPPERLAAILASAGPRALISLQALAARLPGDTPVVALDALPAESGEGEPASAGPRDPAYVIYTSGSTGTPKGVVIEHDAIVNRLLWMAEHYAIGEDERILQKTPAVFDVSVWEFFLPLIVGATLVVAPAEAHKDPAWLAAIIREERITTAHFVPSMLAAFLAEPSAAGLAVRRVICSGEELPAALRDRFHRLVDAELHNLYGPTEAAVDVTHWAAGPGDGSQPVPIGFPVWNTALYILDERLRPVPAEVAGDLYIAGRQLARGYLGRDDLTAERFVPDPFRPGGRMYATGDLARRRDDGAIVFLGRSDHQVKIRGLRIELGEIEAALAAEPGVAQLAVVAREDRPGDRRIVAYLVPAPDGLDIGRLREAARTRLPDYMVPSAFVPLDALPVTRNGKLDRAALPAPAGEGSGGRAAATAAERRVAGLFAELLNLPAMPAADDDFFLLGGHSLLAAQLTLRIRQGWKHPVGLGTVFERPTVAALAQYLDHLDAGGAPVFGRAPGDEGLGPMIPLVRDGAARGPALVCIHPAGGISWCYGRLARALEPARPVFGLQARGLDPRVPLPESLEAMAADYVSQVLEAGRSGPIHLAGWSVGGIIAQAMAVELERRGLGGRIGTLAMLDAYPSDCWRDEPEPDEGAALKALLTIAGQDSTGLDNAEATRDTVIARLRRSGHPLGELTDAALDGVIRVVRGTNRLVRRHRHTPTRARLLHVRAGLDHAGTGLTPALWQPYVGGIEVHEVPSIHAHMTGADAVAHIAPLLAAAMAEHERRPDGASAQA